MRKLIFLTLAVTACGDGSPSAATDYSPILTGIAETVVVPAFTKAASTVDALDEAMATLASAPTPDNLAAARAAWRESRAAYRALDPIHFGPVDGLGIAARIDFAPADGALIDATVASADPLDASTIANAGGGAKGWLGTEHLLFDDAIVTTPRALTYARLATAEIHTSVHGLADAWLADDGIATLLRTPGAGNPRYETQRAAMDDLVSGVSFGLEVVVGVRLALALGRKSTGVPDPAADPTAASDSAVSDMTSALQTVAAMYADPGFSTRIRMKSTVLDDRLSGQLAECQSAIQAIPAPFVDSLTANTAAVQSAYIACKTYKGSWNTDATSALGAALKPTDNDGD